MFASLVNYYKVNEIEKSNGKKIDQMNSNGVFSPKTVASLRRQPLQEVSIDLLRKQQVIATAQTMNIVKVESQAIDAMNEKLKAQQEQYKANEIINSYKKKITHGKNELQLTKEKITSLEKACSNLQQAVSNSNETKDPCNNNLHHVFDDAINWNSFRIYNNIKIECKTIRNQIDGMLSLKDEESNIIFQAKKEFEQIVENLQNDFTKEVQLAEENCKVYGIELVIANEKIKETKLQNTRLIEQIEQLNTLKSQSKSDKEKIKLLEKILQKNCTHKNFRKLRKVCAMKQLKKVKGNNINSKSRHNFLQKFSHQLLNIQQYLSLIDSEIQRLNEENIKLHAQLCSKDELLNISDTTSKTLIATIEINKQEDQLLLGRINSLEEELKVLVKNSPKHEKRSTVVHTELGQSGYDQVSRDIIIDKSSVRLHHVKSLFFCLMNAKSSQLALSHSEALTNLLEFNLMEKKLIKDAVANMYSPSYSVFGAISEDVTHIFSSVTK